MATKTTIQNLINVKLADGSDITAEEHREVENELLLNSYGVVENEKDSSLSNVVTTKNTINTSLKYNIYMCKQGRVVNVFGTITNSSASIVDINSADDFFFEVTNSEYLPLNYSTVRYISGSDLIKIVDNKIYMTVGASTTKNFQLTYFTQN